MSKTLPCGRKNTMNPITAPSEKKDWKTMLNHFLKQKGLRATRQRDQIANVALSRNSHFDIQTLIKEVRARHKEISPATVYRSVKTLCEAGILNETLQTHNGIALYEASFEEHHDHLVCMDCGEIFEFHDAGVEKAQNKAVQALGFEEVRHRHVVYAHCDLYQKRDRR
jgi:Fur family ferric uptake transcriptional regulator